MFIEALCFYEISNPEFCSKICSDIRDGTLELSTSKQALTILTYLVKCEHRDPKVLSKIEDILINKGDLKTFQNHVSMFWAFSVLGHSQTSKRYIQFFESKAMKDDMDLGSLALIMYSYGLISEGKSADEQ